MEYSVFVNECVGIFINEKQNKKITRRITRGQSAIRSSECENLIAKAAEDNIPEKYNIFIDCNMSVKGNKGIIRPDIAIIVNNTLTGIIEVKIDLGFLKYDWYEHNNIKISKLKSAKEIGFKIVDWESGKTELYKIVPDDNVAHCVVVISGDNHAEKLAEFMKLTNAFILMEKHHPNSHKMNKLNAKNYISDIIRYDQQWNKFTDYLMKTYTL